MKRKRTPRWFAPVAILFVVFAAVLVPRWLRGVGDRIPMKVRELRVEGARALSRVDVASLAGFSEGTPLFGKWAGGAAEKMKRHPRVENVTVARDATGKVLVRVSERKPVAMVNLDRLYFVDREGNLLDPVDPGSAEGGDLPVLSGPWREVSSAGLKEELAAGLSLGEFLVRAGFRASEISEIALDDAQGWLVYRIRPSAVAVFGRGDFERKAARLARVVKDFRGDEGKIREIDLSFRDRAVVKMKSAG